MTEKKYDLFEFDEYQTYINAQKEHEETKYRTANRPFLAYLSRIKSVFPEAKKVLCVGSRDVSEVYAFRDHEYEAIGIDLFSDEESTIRIMDMHKISEEFGEDEFDLIFACHSLEHSYNPEVVFQGFRKVSKLGAFIVLPFHVEADFKDPVVLPFMKQGGRPKHDGDKANIESLNMEMIHRDMNSLLSEDQPECKILDVVVYPFYPRWDDGYWISVNWNKQNNEDTNK